MSIQKKISELPTAKDIKRNLYFIVSNLNDTNSYVSLKIAYGVLSDNIGSNAIATAKEYTDAEVENEHSSLELSTENINKIISEKYENVDLRITEINGSNGHLQYLSSLITATGGSSLEKYNYLTALIAAVSSSLCAETMLSIDTKYTASYGHTDDISTSLSTDIENFESDCNSKINTLDDRITDLENTSILHATADTFGTVRLGGENDASNSKYAVKSIDDNLYVYIPGITGSDSSKINNLQLSVNILTSSVGEKGENFTTLNDEYCTLSNLLLGLTPIKNLLSPTNNKGVILDLSDRIFDLENEEASESDAKQIGESKIFYDTFIDTRFNELRTKFVTDATFINDLVSNLKSNNVLEAWINSLIDAKLTAYSMTQQVSKATAAAEAASSSATAASNSATNAAASAKSASDAAASTSTTET